MPLRAHGGAAAGDHRDRTRSWLVRIRCIVFQGDVGSGKTLVAAATMLTAVQGGHQGALMAPTEVLAEQTRHRVRRCSIGSTVPGPGQPVRGPAAARRAADQPHQRPPTGARCWQGSRTARSTSLIGTHALIQEGVEFRILGVVVIDEQHRFGVEQRATLRPKARRPVPDVLVMTATPIPRTAAMTVYGDLDVTVLDELPPGRTPIATTGRGGPIEEDGVWANVRSEVAAGHQAFVVCPLIEEREKLEVCRRQTRSPGWRRGSSKGTAARVAPWSGAFAGEGEYYGRLPRATSTCSSQRR